MAKLLSKITDYLLTENYEIAERNWVEREGISKDKFLEVTNRFKQHGKRKNVSGKDADIAFWMKKPFSEFEKFVNELDKKAEHKAKEKQEGSRDKTNALTVFENDKVKVIIPRTEAASCWFGQNTKWCTTGKTENHFNEYYSEGGHTLYYILIKGPMNEKLMYDEGFIYVMNDRVEGGKKAMEKMYNNIDPKNYNKVCIVVLQKKIEGKKDLYVYDALDNTMKNMWFKMLLTKYDIPEDIFTRRMVKGEKGYKLNEEEEDFIIERKEGPNRDWIGLYKNGNRVAQVEINKKEHWASDILKNNGIIAKNYISGLMANPNQEAFGTRLMKYLISHYDHLFLHTTRQNTKAVNFYKKHGFKILENNPDINMITMWRK